MIMGCPGHTVPARRPVLRRSVIALVLAAQATAPVTFADGPGGPPARSGRVVRLAAVPRIEEQFVTVPPTTRIVPSVLAAGDFDGDGTKEVAVVPRRRGVARGGLLLRSAGGAMTAAPLVLPERPVLAFAAASAELRPGAQSLVVADAQAKRVIVYGIRSDGSAFVQKTIATGPAAALRGIAAADFFAGGRDEVVWAVEPDRLAALSATDDTFAVRQLSFAPLHGVRVISGAARVTTSGPAHLLFTSTKWSGTRASPATGDAFDAEGTIVLADFPYEARARDVPYLHGDLDGDGLDDAASFAGPVYGWWIAISNGITALEMPVAAPRQWIAALDPAERSRAAVADIDGDGDAEAIYADAASNRFVVYRFRLTEPLADAEVRAADLVVRTAQDGTFSICGSDGAVAVEHPRFRFRSNPVRPLRFVGYPSGAPRGAPVSLTGERVPGPYVCSGYLPANFSGKWRQTYRRCPDGYAVFAADDVSDDGRRTPGSVLLLASCCPLPNDDILTDDPPVLENERCPDGYVATGSVGEWLCISCNHPIVCRRVNTARYRLGPLQQGEYWGSGLSSRRHTVDSERNHMPRAIRPGISRVGFGGWDTDGCGPRAWGQLLVGKSDTGCESYTYRTLEYAGADGDPPAGTPVTMFPDCEVDNAFSPLTGCRE